jgi:hypothetical protein
VALPTPSIPADAFLALLCASAASVNRGRRRQGLTDRIKRNSLGQIERSKADDRGSAVAVASWTGPTYLILRLAQEESDD